MTETIGSFRIDRLGGIANVLTALKSPCRVATTAAITLIGLQTIDGVAVLAGDRVLVKDQADSRQNGIYIASASDWVRPADCSRIFTVLKGTRVLVTEGTTQAAILYLSNPTPWIIYDS